MINRYFEINSPGYNIRCKLYCGDVHDIRRVILWGHGFGGHKDNRAAEKFAAHVVSKRKSDAVIVFDWPCHGDDVRKKLTLEDCTAYLRLVIEHIRENIAPDKLFAYATSFGAWLFLKYIAENGDPFDRIALRSPAINMYEVLMGIISDPDKENLQKGKDALAGFDRKIKVSSAFLQELKENDIRDKDYIEYADDILIVQGTKDEILDLQTIADFSENNVIECIMIENADHRFQDPNTMNEATKVIMEHFNK